MRFSFARIGMAFATATVSLVPLAAHGIPVTRTWTGAGGLANQNFSNASNWDTGVPVTGDSLVFPQATNIDTGGNIDVMHNDLVGASFTDISVTGTAVVATERMFEIVGNPLTITGNVTSTAVDGVNANAPLRLKFGADITLGASSQFTNVELSYATTEALNIGANNATFTGSVNYLTSKVTGTGSVILAGADSSLIISNDNSAFGGNFVANGGIFDVTTSYNLGSVSTPVIINAGASLRLDEGSTRTLNNAYTFTGAGTTLTTGGLQPKILANCRYGNCAAAYSYTLAGTITFGSDETASVGNANGALILSAAPAGGFGLTAASGSLGSLTVPMRDSATGVTTTTIPSTDAQPSVALTVANLNKLVVDGVRGDITVQSGGVLGGHGTVGTVTIQSGGALAPGNSPGCLASGNLTLVSGANYNVDIAGATVCTEYDQQVVTGTVDLGSATLNLNLTYVPAVGTTFKIISNDAADPIVGTFAGLAGGATVTANGYNFTISYVGGDGNDVELTAVGPVVIPSLPAAAHSTGTAPILLVLFAILSVTGIEVGRRVRTRR